MMSNIEIIGKIELLPNEILIECFKYLNGFDILYSFNQLNYRFNQLIRSIPLYLDFRNIRRLLFKQFCKKILSKQELKNQIYSLILSNENAYNQFELFFVLFSFDEFPQLQSLTLTKVKPRDVSKLKLGLSLIRQLRSLRIFDVSDRNDELLSILSSFRSQDLASSTLSSYLNLINQFSSLTNLTIPKCSTSSLCQLLSTITSLKRLQVESVFEYVENVSKYRHFWCGTCRNALYPYLYRPEYPFRNLQHLIIKKFQGKYDEIEKILKRTANLTNLIIYIINNNTADINVNKLEHLITITLPYLKVFKFIIQCFHDIEEKFKEFQSDFWCKQHHWYTECSIFKNYGLIYTIPYIFNRYELKPYAKIYYNNLVNNSETFKNVTDLNINLDVLTEKYQYYFSHVKSLTFKFNFNSSNKPIVTKTHIEHLRMIINLSNLKQLDIACCKFETSAILFELLKDTSQLSSLNIHSDVLILLFDDEKLCKYLNKIITKLQVTEEPRCAMDNSCDLNKFCKIFSNIEQLICILDQPDAFFFLLEHLPKLSYINVFSFRFTCGNIDWLEELLEELSLDEKIVSEYYRDHTKHLEIWFTEKH